MGSEKELMDIDGRKVWSLLNATEILKERTGTNYSISGRNGTVMTPLHAATNWRKSKGSDVPDIAPKLNSFKAGGVKFVYVDDFRSDHFLVQELWSG
jgi:hypothetical protein